MARPARIGPSRTLSGSYAPGWVDVGQRWIERLPWPWWLTYAGAWLALATAETLFKWADGSYPVGTLFPYHVVAMGAGVFALAFMFSTLGVLVSLAIVTFLGPIWGAHQRLVAEKERRTSEVYADLETTMQELHRDAGARVYERVDGLTKTLSGLRDELTLLEKASTWPWRTSTLRGFLSAVLLPLFLWFAQQASSRAWDTWAH